MLFVWPAFGTCRDTDLQKQSKVRSYWTERGLGMAQRCLEVYSIMEWTICVFQVPRYNKRWRKVFVLQQWSFKLLAVGRVFFGSVHRPSTQGTSTLSLVSVLHLFFLPLTPINPIPIELPNWYLSILGLTFIVIHSNGFWGITHEKNLVFTRGPLLNLRGFHPGILRFCSMHTVHLGLLYACNAGGLSLVNGYSFSQGSIRKPPSQLLQCSQMQPAPTSQCPD